MVGDMHKGVMGQIDDVLESRYINGFYTEYTTHIYLISWTVFSRESFTIKEQTLVNRIQYHHGTCSY
jgi:hypothetical protein